LTHIRDRRRRKGDETKIALARRLREETAVSLRWIAENLYMGTWTHVSNRFTTPLIKECQYLALTPILSTPIGIVMVNQSLPTHMLQFASFLLLVL